MHSRGTILSPAPLLPRGVGSGLSPYFGGLVGGPLVALLFAIASGAQVGLLLDLFHVFLGIWLVGVVVGMGVIGVGLPTRLKMELAAGYTTANFAHPEVDLVDSKTGIVLRNAGEPLLDRSSFKALREEARALARSESAAVSGNEA